MFWILFAAQLSLPVTIGLRFPDVRSVFTADDMPAYVQIAGITRFVPTRITVSSDGKLQDCSVEPASGDAKLDALTCLIILKRAKFEPATWIDGSAAFGVLRVPVTWAIGSPPSNDEYRRAYPAEMELMVNRLPPGAHRRADVSLMIAVDENGRVVGCSERPPVSPRDHAKRFPQLVPVACQQMTGGFTAVPARDAGGRPVRSVQNAAVAFSIGP
jgi:TonB family protein